MLKRYFVKLVIFLLGFITGVVTFWSVQVFVLPLQWVETEETATADIQTKDTLPSTAEDSKAVDTASEVVPVATDWLNPEQRAMLATLGIDESSLPATLTPALEACFVDALGQTRVDAIKAGETPSVFEAMRAMPCLK